MWFSVISWIDLSAVRFLCAPCSIFKLTFGVGKREASFTAWNHTQIGSCKSRKWRLPFFFPHDKQRGKPFLFTPVSQWISNTAGRIYQSLPLVQFWIKDSHCFFSVIRKIFNLYTASSIQMTKSKWLKLIWNSRRGIVHYPATCIEHQRSGV